MSKPPEEPGQPKHHVVSFRLSSPDLAKLDRLCRTARLRRGQLLLNMIRLADNHPEPKP